MCAPIERRIYKRLDKFSEFIQKESEEISMYLEKHEHVIDNLNHNGDRVTVKDSLVEITEMCAALYLKLEETKEKI